MTSELSFANSKTTSQFDAHRSHARLLGDDFAFQMKFKATIADVGARWLDRFAPIFDKLGSECALLLTPSTLYICGNARACEGVETHADFRIDEIFESYKISSANDDKIAVKLEPGQLARVLRGLLGVEAQRVDVKLIKRIINPEVSSRALPFLNFTTVACAVDVSQDVPIVGPLNRSEVEAYEQLVGANVVDVPYWLEVDRYGLESIRETIERFSKVSENVEITTTRAGALYLSASKQAVSVLGTEYRGLRVLPVDADEYDEHAREPATVSARLAEIKSTGAGSTVRVNVKHLSRGMLGCSSNPSNLLIGSASQGKFLELVFRYGAQTEREGDAVGFMVRIPVLMETDGIDD